MMQNTNSDVFTRIIIYAKSIMKASDWSHIHEEKIYYSVLGWGQDTILSKTDLNITEYHTQQML